MSDASVPQWVLTSLGDLTGQPEHDSQPVPLAWIQWLRDNFPDAEITTEVPEPVPGQLEMLLERRKVVLRVSHFTRAALVAIAQSWVAALVAMSGVAGTGASLVLAGITLLDQFKQLSAALVALDEERGEHCTYTAVIAARGEELRALGHYPDADQVWEAHQRVREHCPVAGCEHQRDGCQATRGDVDVVIDRLVERGALVREKDGLWRPL